MAHHFGRCTNLGHCHVADSRRFQPMGGKRGEACPICGRPLKRLSHLENLLARTSRQTWVVSMGVTGLTLCLMGALVVYWQKRNAASSSETGLLPKATRTAMQAPVALRFAGRGGVYEALPHLLQSWLEAKGGDSFSCWEVDGMRRDCAARIPDGKGQWAWTRFEQHRTSTLEEAQTWLQEGRADFAVGADFHLTDLSEDDIRSWPVATEGVSLVVSQQSVLRTVDALPLRLYLMGKGNSSLFPGGSENPIRVYVVRGHYSESFFRERFLGGDIPQRPRVLMEPDVASLKESLKGDPGGIGVLPLGESLDKSFRTLTLSRPGAVPIALNPTSASTGEWLGAARGVLLSTPWSEKNLWTLAFAGFAQSELGQLALRDKGVLPLDADTEWSLEGKPPLGLQDAVFRPETPPLYRTEVSDCQLLTLALHFDLGSSALTPIHWGEIAHVASHLRQQPPLLKVMGFQAFHDEMGVREEGGTPTPSAPYPLDAQRAQVVADALRRKGLISTVALGWGNKRPLALPDSPWDRDNARVEIWACPRPRAGAESPMAGR